LRLKRNTLWVTKPQSQLFRALATRADRGYSELIRAALDDYLRERTAPARRRRHNRKGDR
jgi:hypothetical protein